MDSVFEKHIEGEDEFHDVRLSEGHKTFNPSPPRDTGPRLTPYREDFIGPNKGKSPAPEYS